MAGIYLHIPFCVKKCDYCDFTSFANAGALDGYVEALLHEIELTAQTGEYPASFDTVFFGGGTPSLLSGEQMQRLMEALRTYFPIQMDAECSMECNPGTASKGNLAAYYTAGINRLSIGLQSTNDALLCGIGRIHTFAQFLDTLNWAREAGFTNINADVMHGLPDQTQEQYLDTLKTVCYLEVQHVSSYALTLEEHTPLYARVAGGRTKLPDEDTVADMQDAGIDYLEARGYHRYEISNFAREGYECRHNLTYWKNGEYVGLGLAAHSAVRQKVWTRYANTTSLEEYLRLLRKGRLPRTETIRLQSGEEMFESIMLGFRLTRGIDRAAFSARFGVDVVEAFPRAVDSLKKRDWVVETPDYITLNRRGLDLQNEALGFFL